MRCEGTRYGKPCENADMVEYEDLRGNKRVFCEDHFGMVSKYPEIRQTARRIP